MRLRTSNWLVRKMVKKFLTFLAIVVVFAAQGQAQRKSNVLSGLLGDYLDLSVRVVSAILQNRQIDSECYNIFKMTPTIPKEVTDEITQCAETYAQELTGIVENMPQELKERMAALENTTNLQPTSLMEVISMLGQFYQLIKDVTSYLRKAGARDVIKESLKCTLPIFDFVRMSFREKAEEFLTCAKL